MLLQKEFLSNVAKFDERKLLTFVHYLLFTLSFFPIEYGSHELKLK